MRHLLILVILAWLSACSGYGTVDPSSGEGSIAIPLGSYTGIPREGDPIASQLSFTVGENGALSGAAVVTLENTNGTTTSRSFSFSGIFAGSPCLISMDAFSILFEFDTSGAFVAIATGYDAGGSNRDPGLFSAQFVSDTVPSSAPEGGLDTNAVPGSRT